MSPKRTKRSPATFGQAPIFAQVIALFSVQSGMLECNAFTCYTGVGSGIHAGDCIVLYAVRNAGVQLYIHLLRWGRLWYSRRWLHCCAVSECWNTMHSPATLGQAPVFTQVIALFSMQSGMLEYNTFTCYAGAGSGICAGDCIVLCAVRNAGVQYIHLIHLGRLRYSRRWLHCSLCSQECWNTIYSPATLGQAPAPVFAQVIALFSVQSGMLEYNTFTCNTWASSGIRAGDCIVL